MKECIVITERIDNTVARHQVFAIPEGLNTQDEKYCSAVDKAETYFADIVKARLARIENAMSMTYSQEESDEIVDDSIEDGIYEEQTNRYELTMIWSTIKEEEL